MSKKYLVSLDLNKNELQNARIQNLAAAPSTPGLGQAYYDTVNNAAYVWNGTAWIATDVSKVAAGFIALSKLATDPLARANHTGTQLAATISDFDTQVRTSRLDQMAAPTAAVSANSQKITNLATPTVGTDAATMAYVDAAAQASAAGIDAKPSVRAATTANISLTAPQTVDTVSVVAGDRVLVKNQSTANQNGIYVVAAGAWTRSTDCDTATEYTSQAFTFVEEGGQAGTQWKVSTSGAIVVGTTAVTWAQFGAAQTFVGGNGLVLTGNTFDVGAGTGITVAADTVGIDTAVVVRKFAATIGDGTTTALAVTHNLGTQDITVSIREVATNAFVEADIVATSTNVATITFAVAPTASAIRVVVHG